MKTYRRALPVADPIGERVATQGIPLAGSRLGLLGQSVDVWLAKPSTVATLVPEFDICLSADERADWQRLRHEADRQSYAAAHVLLRHLLSGYGNLPPQAWSFTRTAHGRPALIGCDTFSQSCALRFSLSHTRGWVAVAIAWWQDVGVDVECLRDDVDIDGIAPLVFTPAEYARWHDLPEALRADTFVRIWTLKEAVLKAYGVGISTHLRSLYVQLEGLTLRSIQQVHVDPDFPSRPNGFASVTTWGNNQSALAVAWQPTASRGPAPLTSYSPEAPVAEPTIGWRLFDLSGAGVNAGEARPLEASNH